MNGQGAPLEVGSVPTATGDYLLYGHDAATDVQTGPMSFGVADDAALVPFMVVSYIGAVKYRLPGTAGLGYSGFRIGTYQQEPDWKNGCNAPVRPRLGTPTVAINGSDARHPVASAGTSPVFTWTPSAVGTALRYTLDVYRYDLAPGGATTRQTRVFTVMLRGTRVRIPEGILEAGKTYSALLTATEAPIGITPVRNAWAWVPTSTFVP